MFNVSNEFHEKFVTIYLTNRVKLKGIISIKDGECWLTSKDGQALQQVNPLSVSSISEGSMDYEPRNFERAGR
jgi:GTP-binding protein EngB required for normal cell division